MGNYQLTVQFNITNPHNTQTITYTAFIIAINEGSYSVINGSAIKQIGVVTHRDALEAYNLPEASYQASESVYGGDFFGSLKKLGERLYSGVKSALPYVKKGVEVASMLGLGRRKKKSSMKKSKRRSSMRKRGRGGVILGDGLYGSGLSGGEFIDRKDLTYADEVDGEGYSSDE